MAKAGKRLECPVCTGVRMQKLHPSEELELTLDYCDECGGMWFESGEVRQLRYCPPEVLSGLITVKKQLFTVVCPSCGHQMTRNAATCKSCGRENIINCPVCSAALERVQSDRFTLDVCRGCRGVWFDNIDLSAVWNLEFVNSAGVRDVEPSQPYDGRVTEDTVIVVLRHGGKAGARDGSQAERRPAAVVAVEGSDQVFVAIADLIAEILTAPE
ncbi:MAG: hypothetical protein AMS25_16740 [Gemmatimonas sp. SM23_52]|nr:MAG: hypothetical protein AMS25_16740 [Gemmatimonas sp. SM23_52]